MRSPRFCLGGSIQPIIEGRELNGLAKVRSSQVKERCEMKAVESAETRVAPPNRLQSAKPLSGPRWRGNLSSRNPSERGSLGEPRYFGRASFLDV